MTMNVNWGLIAMLWVQDLESRPWLSKLVSARNSSQLIIIGAACAAPKKRKALS